jgi:sugar phosphate isomerase/epimerase
MWQLSGFADEIAPELTAQCDLLGRLGMRHLELRSAWDVNVLDLDDAQLRTVRDVLSRYGITVSAIGSPIGKIYLDDDFDEHCARMEHAADVAALLGVRHIRMFSFFLRPGDDPARHRDSVLHRLTALTRIAEKHDVVLVHENEKDIYGDIPARCLDIVESVGSDHLRLTWDPANFVQVGCAPFDDGYVLLRPHLAYVQIKDAVAGTGAVVPAGQGDGQVLETLRALRDDGFDGYVSLEPHLGVGHRLGGFSGPELFTQAWRALITMLDAEEITYA